MESSWFDNTVFISFLIFCLYSCSSINKRATQDLKAPETPPYELKLQRNMGDKLLDSKVAVLVDNRAVKNEVS